MSYVLQTSVEGRGSRAALNRLFRKALKCLLSCGQKEAKAASVRGSGGRDGSGGQGRGGTGGVRPQVKQGAMQVQRIRSG